MSRAYAEIAFTPSVRSMQEQQGSRGQYALLDHEPERGDLLTEAEAAFIETRDTFFQAIVGEAGWPYVQHRGGPPGFVRVLDPKTIAFPDFSGNMQYISVGSVLRDDRIAMILMDFAKQRRLKIYGRVRLAEGTTEPELMQRLRLPDYRASVERAFVVSVEAFDWNCPQHITPRFTEDEIVMRTASLRVRAEKAERSLAGLAAPHSRETLNVIGSGPLRLVVAGVRQLTPRVRSFELRTAEQGTLLPAARAGAHLALPVQLPDGTETTRRYSIARVAPEGDAYEVAVLLDAVGRGGSQAIHATCRLGTELRCEHPENFFPLEAGERPVILVAGGIGITPIRAMAAELRASGRSHTVHYAARSRAEAAYLPELRAEVGANLNVYSATDGTRIGIQGIVAAAVDNEADIYVCGPAGMLKGFRDEAARRGLDSARMHVEAFAVPVAGAADRVVNVALRRSGVSVRVPPDRSILEAVEQTGIAVRSGCRTGVCGACAVRVIAGEPQHRDTVLSETVRVEGGVMCICVSRATGGSLVLDL
jgi:ferredoxin-NADP reductase/predicted pyridoxine 5'-phosphate oxidase superfamily flavin-nucleotide-binding protein